MGNHFKDYYEWEDSEIAGVQINFADVFHRSARLNFWMLAAAEGCSLAEIFRVDVMTAKFNRLLDPELLERYVFFVNGKWIDSDDELL